MERAAKKKGSKKPKAGKEELKKLFKVWTVYLSLFWERSHFDIPSVA